MGELSTGLTKQRRIENVKICNHGNIT